MTRNMSFHQPVCSMLVILALLSLILAVPTVSGRSFRLDRVPVQGRSFGCALCHANPRGGGDRNPFGRDYHKIAIPAGDTYSSSLGKLDSDSDGFSNDAEFTAGTHPGDAASTP